MLKVINLEKYDINRYALVLAVAKRARQIANEGPSKKALF